MGAHYRENPPGAAGFQNVDTVALNRTQGAAAACSAMASSRILSCSGGM
jgi:hypothetical protein